jgi:hypothetical protein
MNRGWDWKFVLVGGTGLYAYLSFDRGPAFSNRFCKYRNAIIIFSEVYDVSLTQCYSTLNLYWYNIYCWYYEPRHFYHIKWIKIKANSAFDAFYDFKRELKIVIVITITGFHCATCTSWLLKSCFVGTSFLHRSVCPSICLCSSNKHFFALTSSCSCSPLAS